MKGWQLFRRNLMQRWSNSWIMSAILSKISRFWQRVTKNLKEIGQMNVRCASNWKKSICRTPRITRRKCNWGLNLSQSSTICTHSNERQTSNTIELLMRWSRPGWQSTVRRPKSRNKTWSCWRIKRWLSSRGSASLFLKNSDSSGKRTPRIKRHWWVSSKQGWRITKKRPIRQDTRCLRLPTRTAKAVCKLKWWRQRFRPSRTWSRALRASSRRLWQPEMHPLQKQPTLNWYLMHNWSIWMNYLRNLLLLKNNARNRARRLSFKALPSSNRPLPSKSWPSPRRTTQPRSQPLRSNTLASRSTSKTLQRSFIRSTV